MQQNNTANKRGYNKTIIAINNLFHQCSSVLYLRLSAVHGLTQINADIYLNTNESRIRRIKREWSYS